MKAFLQGTLKLALAISLALVAAVAVIAGGYKFLDDREKNRIRAEAAPYEQVSRQFVDLKKPLDITFTVETKVVDGYMYASITGSGFPKYLEHPTNKANGAFILKFSDRDGFKLYEKSIPIRDFTTLMGTQNANGLSYQFKEFISLSEYKRFTSTSIGWTVDEKLIPMSPQQPPTPKPTVTHPDPCAPGLSKADRLSRLANFGVVRQTGRDSYSAGSRSITFFESTLMYCN